MKMFGLMYEIGYGSLPKDEANAVEWYRKSAVAGNGEAMRILGAKLLAGRGGLPKDEATAMEWYRKSAEAGDGQAMFVSCLSGWHRSKIQPVEKSFPPERWPPNHELSAPFPGELAQAGCL